ncbi:hypothetical protein EVAR_19254_1 [Eumeta japonica]|uniref:Uncharacterized protein n=1 Tax=Eumeta variegata TaxID=151549 RepID=A0A4C1UE23_EUMVA|nr:hypothetical protein EVAR_19254_1 [Eumeta japonica]
MGSRSRAEFGFRMNNFAKETIVFEVGVSEKNSLEYLLKIHELTALATADDPPPPRSRPVPLPISQARHADSSLPHRTAPFRHELALKL